MTGDVDACYLHYLQALATLDDAWGDPRRPGQRGHPFAAFLVWKLGIIASCRADTKCIVKFGDYFRSLALYYDLPFSWLSGITLELAEDSALQVLRRTEPEWQRWLWRHDVLCYGQEGLVQTPCTRHDEVSQVPSTHNITGDRQDVFRGTVMACGVNELGQLGVEDLPWSAAPVRLVALKEVRIKDVACGEAHCLALDVEDREQSWQVMASLSLQGHVHTWGFDTFSPEAGEAAESASLRDVKPTSPKNMHNMRHPINNSIEEQ